LQSHRTDTIPRFPERHSALFTIRRATPRRTPETARG
jgi:hypothetical protein